MRKLVSLILTIIISVSVLSVVSMAEDKTLILSESFDQYADNNEAYNELSKNWLLEDGANTSWPDYFNLIENGNGKALSMTWVGARRMLLTGKYIPSDYEVSFKMKTEYTTPNGGFFSMHTMVDLPYVTQKWDDATQTIVPFWGGIPNYEADGHSDPLIANGVGYAGVYIKPERNKLEIGVKTAEIPSATAKYGIGNIRYFVDLPDGKDFGTELLQVRITDKDNIISVYVDDTLLATVTYGNISGLLMILCVISVAPMFIFIGKWSILPLGIIFAAAMYYANKIERIKKDNDIQTYKEIVAFTEGKKLDEIQKQREIGKRPYQKFLIAVVGAVIAALVSFVIAYFIMAIRG